MRFKEKSVVVTGAGRNVGRAVARRFVREGARVAVVELDAERGQAACDELNAIRTGSARFVSCDVSSSADVQRMVATVAARHDGLDVLVNNVAISDRNNVLGTEDEDWHRVMSVTLDSVFFCSKYAGRQMVEQGRGGVIINIGSTSAHRGRTMATAYPAAKAGVVNFTRVLAAQLGPHGIRVNTVTPNKVGSAVGEDTETSDRARSNLLGRGAVPDDVANAVAFLASDEAGFITAAELLVDGGALFGGRGPAGAQYT